MFQVHLNFKFNLCALFVYKIWCQSILSLLRCLKLDQNSRQTKKQGHSCSHATPGTAFWSQFICAMASDKNKLSMELCLKYLHMIWPVILQQSSSSHLSWFRDFSYACIPFFPSFNVLPNIPSSGSLVYFPSPLSSSLPRRVHVQDIAEHSVPLKSHVCLLKFGIRPQNESYAEPKDLFSLPLLFPLFRLFLASLLQPLHPVLTPL